MPVFRKRRAIFETISKTPKLQLTMKRTASSEKKSAALQFTHKSVSESDFAFFKRFHKSQKTKSSRTTVRMLKISITEFVFSFFSFFSRSNIPLVFQNFNYYASLMMSSKTEKKKTTKMKMQKTLNFKKTN